MANSLLSGVNDSGSAESLTRAAVSDGSITVRDTAAQTQDVANLSRDVAHANQTLSPIFDLEKEQNRLQASRLISEIGSQAIDAARTQGDINGLEAAKKAHPGLSDDALRKTDAYRAGMQKFGTGSAIQKGIQAATAALQGLAGGNISGAIAGASAPYLAGIIHDGTTSKDANGITSVDAQNQQQVKDAMINYFMVTQGVDRQAAESYTETKQGLEIIAASVTPLIGQAASNKLSYLGVGKKYPLMVIFML